LQKVANQQQRTSVPLLVLQAGNARPVISEVFLRTERMHSV